MKKNIIIIILTLCLIAGLASFLIVWNNRSTDTIDTIVTNTLEDTGATEAGETEKEIKVIFNEERLDLEGRLPYIENDHLMLPVEQLVKQFGAIVSINKENQLEIDTYKHVIKLAPKSNSMFVDEKEVSLATEVVKKDGVYYASSDFLTEDFDISVEWDKASNTCVLNTKIAIEDKVVEDMQIASIRFQGQYEEVAEFYLALKEVVGDKECGPVFSLYYDQDYENGHDIEICLQVTETFEDVNITTENGNEAVVSCRTLEGGRFLSSTYLGHSKTLQYLWVQIEQYATDNNIEFGSPAREIYEHEDFENELRQVTTVQIPIIE